MNKGLTTPFLCPKVLISELYDGLEQYRCLRVLLSTYRVKGAMSARGSS